MIIIYFKLIWRKLKSMNKKMASNFILVHTNKKLLRHYVFPSNYYVSCPS